MLDLLREHCSRPVPKKVATMASAGPARSGGGGTAAAVANAICHATGKRVRSLPVTVDKRIV